MTSTSDVLRAQIRMRGPAGLSLGRRASSARRMREGARSDCRRRSPHNRGASSCRRARPREGSCSRSGVLRRGVVEAKKDNHETAVIAYLAALGLRPTSASAHLGAARLLLRLERYADAETQANLALDIEPKNASVVLLLGDISRKRGDPKQAHWAYKRAAVLDSRGKTGKAARRALDSMSRVPAGKDSE